MRPRCRDLSIPTVTAIHSPGRVSTSRADRRRSAFLPCTVMKATPPPAADRPKARGALVEAAGAYLRNPVREPGVTCRMCAAPVEGFEFCWCCQQHRAISGIADLVVPLTYAINGSESAVLVRDYKNHAVRSVRQAHSHVIGSLVELAVSTHERCVAAVVGSPVSTRIVVPSLTSRPGLHPLAQIAARMNLVGPAELVVTLDARCDRAVCADKFARAALERRRGETCSGHRRCLDNGLQRSVGRTDAASRRCCRGHCDGGRPLAQSLLRRER